MKSESDAEPNVPKVNIDTYAHLYAIENGLRELIIERLTLVGGPRWHKVRLPPDLIVKSQEAFKNLRSIPWDRYIPYHTIYYLDFSELRKIIEPANNWRDAFHAIFTRKDIILATLAGLEPIRNNIAHNRRVSPLDYIQVKAAYDQIEAAIGSSHFHTLVSAATEVRDLPTIMASLQHDADASILTCVRYELTPSSIAWQTVQGAWWFDESYLLHDITAIETYFRLLEGYSRIPRRRGTGYRIEEWVRQNDLTNHYEAAKRQISEIVSVRD